VEAATVPAHMAQTVHVARPDDLAAALATLGLGDARTVLVVVGGAQTLTGAQLDAVEGLLATVVVPLCDELGAAVVDGGTDVGVMAAMGRARAAKGGTFPLVGVVATGTVVGGGPSGVGTVAERAHLEQHHTHFVVVPGSAWGDESPWIIEVARQLAAGSPVAGLLVGGGDISAHDVDNLVAAGYPVLALAHTGGVADRLAGEDHAPVDVVDGLARPADLGDSLRRALR
jgi:hypothetical protein